MDENTPQAIPVEIRTYLEGIIEEADILIFDEQDREEILGDMYEQLNQFLIQKILELLPEEKIDAFIALDEENKGPDDIQKFLEATIPEEKEVLAQAYDEFKQVYLETIAIEAARMEALEENAGQAKSGVDILRTIASGVIPNKE